MSGGTCWTVHADPPSGMPSGPSATLAQCAAHARAHQWEAYSPHKGPMAGHACLAHVRELSGATATAALARQTTAAPASCARRQLHMLRNASKAPGLLHHSSTHRTGQPLSHGRYMTHSLRESGHGCCPSCSVLPLACKLAPCPPPPRPPASADVPNTTSRTGYDRCH